MTETVPVIDLTPLIKGADDAGCDGVAGEIADACRHWGFFQVVNHGIPRPLIDRVWQQTIAFFDLPLAERRKLLRTKDNPRGYYDRELTKNARDLKEVFDFGLDPFPDLPSDHPANHLPVDGHNLWPSKLPDFQPTMSEYFRPCDRSGQRPPELSGLGLGAPRRRPDA